MSKKMVTTQPGLFLFTDKDSAFQVTETGATVNGKELGMSEAWAWVMDAIDTKAKRVPDPITGLVPCGCGGKAKVWPSEPTQFTHVITDYEVGCTECAMTTGWVRGKQENAMKVWNTAMGYTAPPRPGAIGPDAGEMDPNGDEGARE